MVLEISVIIPTMNRPESLDRTLMFMSSSKDVPQQIIVVDQTQSEETRRQNEAVLNKYDVFPSRIYDYQEEPSLTRARNRGLKRTTNEILVFSDDDVDVNDCTFSSIASIMSDTQIAMIAGIDELTMKSSTNIGYLLGTKSFLKRKIGHVTASMLGRYPDEIQKQITTQWAQGYFFAVRKSCLSRWKINWDENLTSYAYAEDLDFSYTYYKFCLKENLKCVLDPSVKVKHLASLEYRVPGKKSTYMFIINRKYLAKKHKMGLVSYFARNWCEFWMYIRVLLRHQDAHAFLQACLSKIKYAKEINSGDLNYEKFMK